MKRILTLLLAATVAVLGATAQMRWGATAGMTVTTLKFKQSLFRVDQRCGGSAGIAGELMFPGLGFGINLGLNYELRGAELALGDKLIWASQSYGAERIYLHDIDIPLNLRFKWTRMNGLEDYWAPFVFGGPTFSFTAGHSRCDAIDFVAGNVGLGVGLGFELWRRWQVSASYTWGMTYALKTKLLTNLSAQNRTWDIRVTYFF